MTSPRNDAPGPQPPRPRMFLSQPIRPSAEARLRELGDLRVHGSTESRISRSELQRSLADADVLLSVGNAPVDEEVFRRAPRLRLVAAMHTRAPWVDHDAATRRGILVTGVPVGNVMRTTAELTFALLVAAAWRLVEADGIVRRGAWGQMQSERLLTSRLFGKTLGILGLGEVGRGLVAPAHGMGMDVLYHKRNRLSEAAEQELGVGYRALDALFRECDFLAVTLPLTAHTSGLVDERLLGLLKPSAILVNSARGEIVDESALADALTSGRLRGAALDVVAGEHLGDFGGPSQELLRAPNLLISPHIGTAAVETREEMCHRMVDNVAAFLSGERPPDLLNPQSIDDTSTTGERRGEARAWRRT